MGRTGQEGAVYQDQDHRPVGRGGIDHRARRSTPAQGGPLQGQREDADQDAGAADAASTPARTVLDDRMTTATWLRYWLDRDRPGRIGHPGVARQIPGAHRDPGDPPHRRRASSPSSSPVHVQQMIRTHAKPKGLAPASIVAARTAAQTGPRCGRGVGEAAAGQPGPPGKAPPKRTEAKIDDALDADEAAKVLDRGPATVWRRSPCSSSPSGSARARRSSCAGRTSTSTPAP